MPRRGTAPDGPALAVIHGGRDTTTPDPAGEDPEPTATAAVACPDGIPDDIVTIWTELAPTLPQPLAPVDVYAFRALCTAILAFNQADELIDASGIVISDSHGDLVENPVLKIRNIADAQITKWATKFGLTPADRPRNTAPTTPGRPQGLPHLFE